MHICASPDPSGRLSVTPSKTWSRRKVPKRTPADKTSRRAAGHRVFCRTAESRGRAPRPAAALRLSPSRPRPRAGLGAAPAPPAPPPHGTGGAGLRGAAEGRGGTARSRAGQGRAGGQGEPASPRRGAQSCSSPGRLGSWSAGETPSRAPEAGAGAPLPRRRRRRLRSLRLLPARSPRRPRAARSPGARANSATRQQGGGSRAPAARSAGLEAAAAGSAPSGSRGQALPGAEHGAGRGRAAKAAPELCVRCVCEREKDVSVCVCVCVPAWQRLGYGHSRGWSCRPRHSAAPSASGRGLRAAPRPLGTR